MRTGAGVAAAVLVRPAQAAVSGFVQALATRLDGCAVGVQFTVSNRYSETAGHAWGFARLPHSGGTRSMATTDKYNVASVSKTVTAAALLRALYDNPSVALDSPFAPSLPSHWPVHSSLKNVTFRQLLRHESGILADSATTYSNMKLVMFNGVNKANIGTGSYNNNNYGLRRLLIPQLAYYNIYPIPAATTGALLQSLEQGQAGQFATDYMDYVQRKVWDKTGVAPNMLCKPPAYNPGLCYQSQPTLTTGEDFGDCTLKSASGGWSASSFQLASFARTLHETPDIMPYSLAKLMADDLLGYDQSGKTATGDTYFWKGGYYPGSMNDGQLHSGVFGFSNGVYAGFIMNSPIASGVLPGKVIDAFNAAYK